MYATTRFLHVALAVAVCCCTVSGRAFCEPADECWPPPSAWRSLNATLAGRLSELARDAPTTDPACSSSDARERVQHPACMQFLNTEYQHVNLSEPLATPAYVARVQTPEDVAAVVRFAAAANVRLAVRATGHDFLGRSTAQGSLLLWLHDLDTVDVQENYSDGCSPSGPAVRVGGGTQWGSVYPRLSPAFHAVGGNALTVSAAGGYLQGGGHSAMSPSYGLAVDNVLSMLVVTADGRLRVASPCENADLFWALRGGGGGTFGVVVEAVHRLHRRTSGVVGVDLVVPVVDGADALPLNFTRTIVSLAPTADSCWGGYVLSYPQYYPQAKQLKSVFLLHLVCTGGWERARSAVDFFTAWYDEQKRANPWASVYGLSLAVKNHTDFWAWHANTTDAVGYGTLLASRLLPRASFRGDTGEALAQLLLTLAQDRVSLTAVLLGGAVAAADPAHTHTCVSPSFRNAVWHLVAGIPVEDVPGQAVAAAAIPQILAALQAIAPDAGVYPNEAAYKQAGWESAYWGNNYATLQQIKRKYDPAHLFACHHCVEP